MKINLSDECRKRIIEEIDKTEFFQTVEYVGEYKGYLVYVFSFLDKENPPIYGLPDFLLVKDPEVRNATLEEKEDLWKLF